MSISYFGYQPEIIQTDNEFEFTHFKEAKRIHFLMYYVVN
ncbi:hypothetical protein HMPREF9129_0575 [Peptoniphilus indolicus ATCC 29427]|uniref:Uncharacterized protein n=1 Tax=Peptoniphilus indolicus ATCC 29427 TaxID=997350 RepID=G4D2E5_9FIRM|nr:hypothetical protein HMPREF9129_0575 [Peptoniphilus indolicus ATCC 29427]